MQESCGDPGAAAATSTQIDWDIYLGASMADGTFPAKYNFDLPGETPTCADFVVYGLNTPGVTNGQPNLVGLTNLYSGTANGAGLCNNNTGVYRSTGGNQQVYAATVKFAFNGSTLATAGSITNSVVMSEDGTKVAYVESNGTDSALHVVSTTPGTNGTGAIESFNQWGNWAANAAAAAPGSIKTIPGSGYWTAADSYSSVWVDYSDDLAYVGTDDGSVHKIQNIFCTTASCIASPVDPSEATTGGWPVTLSGAGKLTSPVEDANGVIYLAGANGYLYAITSAGVVTPSKQLFLTNSIVDGAMLDIDGNETTTLYWFSNSSLTEQQPQMVQTDSAFTPAKINYYPLLLNGTAAWGGTTTTVHMGTFDNAFYTNRIGNMWACGWWQNGQYSGYYLGVVRFAVDGTKVTPDVSQTYAEMSTTWASPANLNTCAPLTEVLDSAGADHIFASSYIGYNCASNASCIYGFTIDSTGTPPAYSLPLTGSYNLASTANTSAPAHPTNDYTSGIIVDNMVNPASSTCGPNADQTCAQAASIYFTYGTDAIKLTQAQLQ
jgi:hypothetical protein